MRFIFPTIVAATPLIAILMLFTQANFETHFYNIHGTSGILILWGAIILSMIIFHFGELLVRSMIHARWLYPWFATSSYLILMAVVITARLTQNPQLAAMIWLYITPVMFLVLGRVTAHKTISPMPSSVLLNFLCRNTRQKQETYRASSITEP